MASTHEQRPSAAGSLKERPVARLLQQLFRKQVTGCLRIVDETGDQSDMYLRAGMPVHVQRPVDIDRLDRVLVEHGLVTERAVELATPMVVSGMRLGEALERMGVLTQETLANVLKTQMRRKLTRLFCVADGSFAIFLEAHAYGEGNDHAIMRVDPRTLYFPAIRTTYDLPRVTRELSRLWGQEFRLAAVSPTFITAMEIAADDPVVAALRKGWLTLEKIDSVTARPLEVRTALLSLYYADLLERQKLVAAQAEGEPSAAKALYASSDSLIATLGDPNTAEPAPCSAPATLAGPVADRPPAVPRSSPAPDAAAKPVATTRPSPSPDLAAAPVATTRPSPLPDAGAAPVAAAKPSPSPDAGAAPVAAAKPSPSPAAAAPVAAAKPSPSPAAAAPLPAVSSAGVTPSADAAGGAPTARRTGSVQIASTPDTALRAALLALAQKLDELSHFELLGVSESAPASEISVAFFRAARRYHPDRLTGAGLSELAPHAERILARMSEAAMILGDPVRRADYLASRTRKKAPGSTIPTVVEAETIFLKGEVFLKKGDYAKAIECFTAACRANPSEPQFRAFLAWARFENPKARKESVVREVQRIIADVVAAQPRFARGHYWLGQIWKFLNEPERAEHAFREAVNQDQAFLEANRELRLLEMRRTRSGTHKASDPPRGGLMSRLFKK